MTAPSHVPDLYGTYVRELAELIVMHGVRRSKDTPEAKEARKKKEQAKIKEYLALYDEVFAKKKAKDWSKRAFDLTTELLHINPPLYAVWNYRRHILLNGLFKDITPSEILTFLNADLSLTMSALLQHPKVYWIWNHRMWCLENIPSGPTEENPLGWKRDAWAKEVYVVEKMLDRDPRNFLAWDYRRYVLSSSPEKRSPTEELAYTTRKIEANFSNFSAWHQRSKIYTSLWENGALDMAKTKDSEFELVKQAIYVDPNDQSAWLYHRWLIGKGTDRLILQREIAIIQELLEIEPDSKWCLESLVHYNTLLLKTEKVKDEQERISDECRSMLDRLTVMDPKRKHRARVVIVLELASMIDLHPTARQRIHAGPSA